MIMLITLLLQSRKGSGKRKTFFVYFDLTCCIVFFVLLNKVVVVVAVQQHMSLDPTTRAYSSYLLFLSVRIFSILVAIFFVGGNTFSLISKKGCNFFRENKVIKNILCRCTCRNRRYLKIKRGKHVFMLISLLSATNCPFQQ